MKYDYLINRQRPASSRPRMSAADRAAQFSAFAALVGLDKQMDETARLVDTKIELSEDEIAILNRKFQDLVQRLNEEQPQIKVCYFVPDERKNGGANRTFAPLPKKGVQPGATGVYVTKIGTVKRIDEVFFKLLFADGTEIHVCDVLDFEITE